MFELRIPDLAAMNRDECEAAVRARAQAVHLGDNSILARVLGRYKMFLDARDRGLAPHLMLDGYWEMWVTLFFAKNIKSGMTAIDVGANVGYYTCLLADAVGSRGSVFAFEPVPATARWLQQNVQLNGFGGWTTVVEAAATSFEGEIGMMLPSGEPKNAAIVAPSLAEFKVKATTLDQACAGAKAVDMIKIDAEGAEESIFAGMKDLWKRHRPGLVIEYNAGRYTNAGGFLEDLVSDNRKLFVIRGDGNAAPINFDTILKRRPFDDWLLYIAP